MTKNIFSATGIITIAGFVTRLFAIISAPILTPLLGPEPYGVIGLLGTFISLAGMLFLMGMDFSYNRFGYGKNVAAAAQSEIFCWRFVIKSSAVALIAFCLIEYVGLHKKLGLAEGHMLAAGICVVLTMLLAMAQTRQRMKGNYLRIAWTQIFAAAISTLINILLAWYWRQDAWVLIAGTCAVSLITFISLGMPTFSVLKKQPDISADKRREILTFGLYGSAISAPLYWIISSSDRWFMGAYLGMAALGVYAFTYNIAVIGQMLNSSISVIWRTEALKIHEERPASASLELGIIWARFLLMLAITWLAIAAAGGDIIRLIAAPEFHSGTSLVPWLAGAVFLRGLGQISGIGFMINKNMLPNTYWYIAAALICLLLNFWLIPRYAIMGAALAQFGSFAFAAIGILFSAQRSYAMHIPMFKISVSLLCISAAGAVMSQTWSDNALLSLSYKFPVGVILALALLWYLEPVWLRVQLKKMGK